MLTMATTLINSFTSCSDDDGESYIPSPTVISSNGNAAQVTNVGGIHFAYDENGKLTSIGDGSNVYYLKGNKFSFSTYDNDSKGTTNIDIYLNPDGLITKFQSSLTYIYGKEEATINYSYDTDHRLKACEGSGKGSFHDDSYKGSIKISYTWNNGNLTKAKIESQSKGTEYSESYSDSSTEEHTYTYGTQANIAKQLPYYMGCELTGIKAFGGPLSVIGLYGFGPSYLPTSYTTTEAAVENGKSHTFSNNYTLSFTQNNDGTISSETRNGSRLDYGYKYISTRSEVLSTQNLTQYVHSLSSLFKHRTR